MENTMSTNSSVPLVAQTSTKAAFVSINGLRVRYLTAGSVTSPVLLLIHPVGYPAEVFVRTLSGLADRFHVIAPDLAGQGFSDPPAVWDEPPQVLMAKQVLGLLDHLGHQRVSLLGSSLGGLIAGLLAWLHPDRIENLIIVGSGSVFNEPSTLPRTLQATYENGSRPYADPSLAVCRDRLARTCFIAPDAEDLLLTQITEYALPGAGHSYQRIIEGMIAAVHDPQATVFPHLEEINVRTLVMLGREDLRTKYEAHRTGAARLPLGRLAVIEKCGHLPQLEQAAIFNDLVTRFLNGEAVGERPVLGTDTAAKVQG
jgi:2-hydroxy-6-oxonona-2,4-dienedioate hydrolase